MPIYIYHGSEDIREEYGVVSNGVKAAKEKKKGNKYFRMRNHQRRCNKEIRRSSRREYFSNL